MAEEPEMLWVPDQEQLWLPAQLVRKDDDSFLVRFLDGREVHLLGDPNTFQRVAPGSLDADIENLADLQSLNEGIVHHVLKKRSTRGDTATLAGDILLLLNSHSITTTHPSFRGVLSSVQQGVSQNAHLLTVAANAYEAMKNEQAPHALLLMGVSGSGKTAAANQLMRGFAELSDSDKVVEQLDASSIIIEAFGHARAGRNQSSSRYAMWTSIGFDTSGALSGFHHQMYNLEKTRLVHQAGGDSNFAVFNMILAGIDEELRRAMHIRTSNPGAYTYLAHAPGTSGDHDQVSSAMFDVSMDVAMTSAQEFAGLCAALTVLGIDETQQRDLFSILIAILLLGNIVFEDDGDKGCKTLDAQQMSIAAQALRVESVQLDSCLRFRETVMDRNDKYLVELDKRRTVEQRDAMAKELYSRVFDWLLAQLNAKSGCFGAETMQLDGPNTIAIFDICGFQNAEVNSLEHLCINYWNEKVFQYFTDATVTSIVEMYKAEGVGWESGKMGDAGLCIDLLESRGGLLSLLEEEAALPRGSDSKLVGRFHSTFGEGGAHKCFSRNRRKNEVFTVRHFVEGVNYTIDGFVEKAKDAIPLQIAPLLASSGNALVRLLFTTTADDQQTEPGRKSKKNVLRVKSEVQQLVTTLSTMKPHFVQCIKTSSRLSAAEFDGQTVMSQFSSAGMYDKILVKQKGWVVQLSHEEFVNQYVVCLPRVSRSTTEGTAAKVAEIMEYLGSRLDIPSSVWTMGTTKIFFQNAKVLEETVELVEAGKFRLLVKLQSRIRRLLGRQRAKARREEKQMIAQAERARLDRENNAMRMEDELMCRIVESEQLAIRLQKEEEERLENERLAQLAAAEALRHKSATSIQSVFRGNVDRTKFEVYSAIMKLQKAMQSVDQGQLSAAIHDATILKNQYPTNMILNMLQEANQILKRARQVRQTRDQLADAIVQQDIDVLRHALETCEEKDCTELQEYLVASHHLQRLERKHQLVNALKFLGNLATTPVALLSYSDEIDSLLNQAHSQRLSEHPVVVTLRNRLTRVQRLRNLRDDLRDACEMVSESAIKAALNRLKSSILLHGEKLCEVEVDAALQILKMLELEDKVREFESPNDGLGEHFEEFDARLPVRIRRRLDMLQGATTESERQYATNVVEAECQDPNALARYKRAYKWVVAFCSWKHKHPSVVPLPGQPTTDPSGYSLPSLRTAQRDEQPLLGSLRTLWEESSVNVREMDFETLVEEFTSNTNFTQQRTGPMAEQLIADVLDSHELFHSQRPQKPAFK